MAPEEEIQLNELRRAYGVGPDTNSAKRTTVGVHDGES